MLLPTDELRTDWFTELVRQCHLLPCNCKETEISRECFIVGSDIRQNIGV